MNFQYYFKEAQMRGWAIGQFNISNLETLRAIIQAAKTLVCPVIIGTSEGESRFLGLRQTAALVESFRKETRLPIFLNLDHGKDFDYIKEAVDMGYSAVHFDGSNLSLADNIEMTKRVVNYARKRKVLVEGEVGSIKGSSRIIKERIGFKKEDLTHPREALRFVKETEVDSLAVNIGTFHGVSVLGENPHINLARLKEIGEKIRGKAFLVLHGGSGTPEEDIKGAIELGIVKININTELRLAFTDSLKKSLKEKPEETTPYKYMEEVISAVQKTVEDKMKLFGSINKL